MDGATWTSVASVELMLLDFVFRRHLSLAGREHLAQQKALDRYCQLDVTRSWPLRRFELITAVSANQIPALPFIRSFEDGAMRAGFGHQQPRPCRELMHGCGRINLL